jgi:hypothetical protein
MDLYRGEGSPSASGCDGDASGAMWGSVGGTWIPPRYLGRVLQTSQYW